MKKATIAKLLVVCLIASMLCIPAGAVEWGDNQTLNLKNNATLSADDLTAITEGTYTVNADVYMLTVSGTVLSGVTLKATYGSSKTELFTVKGEAALTDLAAQKKDDSTYSISGSVTLKSENASFKYLSTLGEIVPTAGEGLKAEKTEDAGYITYTAKKDSGTGGGGTGGGTTTPTEPKDTPVTVKPTVDEEKGTASATMSNTQASKMVNDAAKNKSDNVIVTVDVPEGVDVTEVSATIPASAVKGLADKTNANLIVETPVASITLPNAALAALGDTSGTVTVKASKVDENTVKIAVLKNNDEQTSISGGLKAVVPVENTTTGTVAFIVDAEGNKTLIKKSVANADGAMVVPLDGSATITFADNSKDFNDMGSTAWAQEAVNFVSSRELFKGTSDTSFGPTVTMNRAMLVTVLYRLEDASANGTPAFGDVNSGEWYTDAVAWASSNEIVMGLGDGTFGPDAPVSREQIAVFLYRYANVIGIDTTGRGSLDGFDDAAATNSWAQDAMQWAVSINLFQGDEGTSSLRPGDSASRAEVATLLMRFVQHIAG